MANKEFVPTLLIGVGGLGGGMVNEIYGRIPADRRDRVGVHAFDTDVNDLQRHKHLAGRVTQTSGPWTVGQFLDTRAPDDVTDWFPDEFPALRRKTLTEGAGQVRTVSRLAFQAAMETSGLAGLSTELQRLTTARGDTYLKSLRVVVVGSMMGGTGSGIFIQLGLYLRDLLRRQYQIENVLIRGAFLLPDAMLKGGANLPPGQVPNVLANAYASLKELEAISVNAQPQPHASKSNPLRARVAIELRYRPASGVDAQASAVLPADLLPYDYVSLWDYETSSSQGGGAQGIGGFANYRRQVVDAVYSQLFTPMADGLFSIEDNQILSNIQSKNRSRYCSAGVARLVYPYEDVLSYCAARWSEHTISSDWLRLDRQFSEIRSQYRQDLRNGVYRDKAPDRRDHFLKALETQANAGDRLFRTIHHSLWETPHERPPEQVASSRFVAAVTDRIAKLVEDRSDLAKAAGEATLDEQSFSHKDQAASEQHRVEQALHRLRSKVVALPMEMAGGILQDVLWDGWDKPMPLAVQRQRGAHVLNSWLTHVTRSLHPLAVRWLLCDIQRRLKDHSDGTGPGNTGLVAANQALEARIRSYDTRFDLPATDDTESAADRLSAANQQNPVAALFKSRFKEWVSEYRDACQDQLGDLTRFAKSKVTEQVFKGLLEAVDALLTQYETFFDQLENEASALQNEANRLRDLHDALDRDDPTRVHVCASAKIKLALWERASQDSNIGSDELAPAVCSTIHSALFDRVWRTQAQRQWLAPAGESIYRDHVQPWAVNYVREHCLWLNMTVPESLRQQAQIEQPGLSEAEQQQIVQAALWRVDRLAQPFLMASSGRKLDPIAFWGIGTDSWHELQRVDLADLGCVKDNSPDPAYFSRHEIVRYRTCYGYMAEDFAKFSAGPEDATTGGGRYYQAYRARVRQVEAGELPTPHLDKRWHMARYMPDLNESVAQADLEREYKAFLLGLVHGSFKALKQDRRLAWTHFGALGRTEPVLSSDSKPAVATVVGLLDALGFNPAMVDGAIAGSQAQQEEDAQTWCVLPGKEDALRKHRFIAGLESDGAARADKGAANMLETVIRLPFGRPADQELRRVANEVLLPTFCDLLIDYCRTQLGAHRADAALHEARKAMQRLIKGAPSFAAADDGSRTQWAAILDAKGLLKG